ncbi:MAG: 3-hydroxyacyl-[acyl-carrier-protein] dehydratase [Gammaproteobacteria bacterium]|jgi:3-hydroxyacyl-[acyl-carrier-protein] dehydratase
MSGFDISKVMALLPHRYPFLLIDKVTDTDNKEFLTAIKNVSFNEPFFQGHFPGKPIMPGVLILEAMAQATGLLSFSSMTEDPESKLHMLVGMNRSRFRGQVIPGDQLEIKVRLTRNMRGIGMFECKAYVNGLIVAESDMMCSAQDKVI